MSFLERNLLAMEGWTRGTVGVVRAAGVAAGFERVVGTDGVETFLRKHGGGDGPKRLEWLGGTSMAKGSASAMVAGLAVGSGNGLGVSMGTGFEWKVFAGKLGTRQALFVFEREAGVVRMALEICDLSEELASGKIVIVAGEGAGEELSGFLRGHLGYEVPTVLHPLGSLMGERRNEMLKVGEGMVRRVVGERMH